MFNNNKKQMNKSKRTRSQTGAAKKELLSKYVINNQQYSGLKYKSIIYEIGDCLMVNNNNKQYQIGRLIKIIPHNGIGKYEWPTIQVQWFYFKKQINRKINGLSDSKKYNSISNHEVFYSKDCEFILIEKVVSKCFVLPIETYLELDEPSKNTYFTRAKYDNCSGAIEPSFQTWETVCLCDTPFNPDQMYIKCTKCFKFYHPKCVDCKLNGIEQIDQFYCGNCKESLNSGNSEEAITKEV